MRVAFRFAVGPEQFEIAWTLTTRHERSTIRRSGLFPVRPGAPVVRVGCPGGVAAWQSARAQVRQGRRVAGPGQSGTWRRSRLREWPLCRLARKTGGQAMDRERLRKVVALLYVLPLPILLLVAAPAVAQAPTPGKPKVDRLVMGLITPYLDYVRPWINGTADHNIQHDPMLEWLVEVDAV